MVVAKVIHTGVTDLSGATASFSIIEPGLYRISAYIYNSDTAGSGQGVPLVFVQDDLNPSREQQLTPYTYAFDGDTDFNGQTSVSYVFNSIANGLCSIGLDTAASDPIPEDATVSIVATLEKLTIGL